MGNQLEHLGRQDGLEQAQRRGEGGVVRGGAVAQQHQAQRLTQLGCSGGGGRGGWRAETAQKVEVRSAQQISRVHTAQAARSTKTLQVRVPSGAPHQQTPGARVPSRAWGWSAL